MENKNSACMLASLSACLLVSLSTIYGCGNNRHAVIAVTGTNIGLEISQNPANQWPQGKLGYQRLEVAIVPSNRSATEEPGNKDHGAADVADVLMELKFTNIFSLNRAGVYQRLAVGETAVRQSVLMFARDERGKIDEQAAKAIKSVESIRTTHPAIRARKATIANLYLNPDNQVKIEEAVKKFGFKDWNSFVDGIPEEPSIETMDKIENELKAQGILK